MTDTLLAAKQAALSVSSVSGSTLLNGTILKRIAVSGTGLSISDSGHALTLTQDLSSKQDTLTIPASASGTPCLDLSSGRTTVRKFQTSGDSIISMSTVNSGETIQISGDGYTKSQITTYLSGKQDTLANGAGSGVVLLYGNYIRSLAFSGAIAWGLNGTSTEVNINVPCYTQSQSDSRYQQIDSDQITLTHSSGPEAKIKATSTRCDLRYKGGVLRVRREANDGTFSNHCQFADSTGGATVFYNGTSNTSDSKLKDQQSDLSAAECWAIVDQVRPKAYVRNDLQNQPRVGFIAQDLQQACTGPFACIVGEAEQEDGESLLTVDYSRLSTILFRCVQDLHSRLTALETANAAA